MDEASQKLSILPAPARVAHATQIEDRCAVDDELRARRRVHHHAYENHRPAMDVRHVALQHLTGLW